MVETLEEPVVAPAQEEVKTEKTTETKEEAVDTEAKEETAVSKGNEGSGETEKAVDVKSKTEDVKDSTSKSEKNSFSHGLYSKYNVIHTKLTMNQRTSSRDDEN